MQSHDYYCFLNCSKQDPQWELSDSTSSPPCIPGVKQTLETAPLFRFIPWFTLKICQIICLSQMGIFIVTWLILYPHWDLLKCQLSRVKCPISLCFIQSPIFPVVLIYNMLLPKVKFWVLTKPVSSIRSDRYKRLNSLSASPTLYTIVQCLEMKLQLLLCHFPLKWACACYLMSVSHTMMLHRRRKQHSPMRLRNLVDLCAQH